ncbi:MAG: TIGR01777 family protein [Flavobacteriales bacterium]|nr:TIGR01777 family protein [Flavobacteriales bacterium]
MMRGDKVLITGAGGTLAKKVKKLLLKEGYVVVLLTSNIKRCDDSTFYWDIEKGKIDHNSLKDCKHIVHLCGYSIVKPWTRANQKKMYDSRVKAAKLLQDTCTIHKVKLKTFISASAIGYYSSDGDEPKKENDLPGKNWLSKLASDWEESAYKFQKNKVRVVCMRISLLLDLKSGFLKPLVLSAKLGIGTIFGNKSNIIEWIHINDAAKFVSYALNNSNIDGSYNLASKNKVTQSELIRLIKKHYAKYAIPITVPSFILSLIFGKRAQILEGKTKVSVKKLIDTGFKWDYPNLEEALKKETFSH